MNRQARRKQERVKAKEQRAVDRSTSSERLDAQSFDEGLAPVPLSVHTNLAVYKYGGEAWVLIVLKTSGGAVQVLMRPEYAEQFADDIDKIAQEARGVKSIDTRQTDTGLVIAKEMPHA